MKNHWTWACALLAVAFFQTSTQAAHAVAAGKVKAVDAPNKSFVLTDSAGKEWKFKLADDVVVNRGGTESKADLKANDPVAVCYDKGLTVWTAQYILVQEGDTKNQEMVHGALKSFDADRKEVVLTDENKKDWTYQTTGVKVRRNKNEAASIQDIKIGDKVSAIVETVDGKPTLRMVWFEKS